MERCSIRNSPCRRGITVDSGSVLETSRGIRITLEFEGRLLGASVAVSPAGGVLQVGAVVHVPGKACALELLSLTRRRGCTIHILKRHGGKDTTEKTRRGERRTKTRRGNPADKRRQRHGGGKLRKHAAEKTQMVRRPNPSRIKQPRRMDQTTAAFRSANPPGIVRPRALRARK
eukprot:gene14656-biopygen21662